MEPIPDGCRLCLDSSAECFITIDSPELKEQMEKVFSFVVETKQGQGQGVCQSCSDSISEFYLYSEKVRQNQEFLNENATNIGSATRSEVLFEHIKIELDSDSELLKSTANAVELNREILKEEEEVQRSSDNDSYEPPPKKTQTKRMGRPRKPKTKASDSEAEGQEKKSGKITKKSKEEIDKEDQFLKEHFPLTCQLCGETESTFFQLRSHYRKAHKRRDAYVICCEKKFSRRCTILDHIYHHVNPNVFKCEVCSKKYTNKEALSVHMVNWHSSEDQRPYKCDQCPKSYGQKCALNLHMERHQKIECPDCKKLFACRNALKKHLGSKHSGKDHAIICDTCGQEFRTKGGFRRHMDEQHMGIEVPRFQCEICQRWLKGDRNYKTHMKFVHGSNDQVFQCDICQKEYPHLLSLQNHKKLTHAEAKYECEFCGKKFKQSLAWKEHRTTHTGEVLYACDLCGVPYKGRSNLYSHVKKKHPAEWAEKKLKATQGSGPV